MNKRTDWIQTVSGRAFWPLEPDADRLDIEDIAWSLSMQCRYAGHTKAFYSIAEHSVHVSYAVPPEHALCGLLHDASEAYLVDVPRPVKASLPDYAIAEIRLLACIATRYEIAFPFPACIHEADNRILFNERAALLGPSEIPWSWELEPLPLIDIRGWPQQWACDAFLTRFYELTEER